MATTEIAWTDAVWNPVRGCARVSPGCGGGVTGPGGERGGCYAETMAARIVRMGAYEWIDGEWRDDPKKKRNPAARAQADKYKDLVRISRSGEARWTGRFAFDAEKLSEPLRRKTPTMYFVNSMSDLFGEGLTNEQIAAVFGVMAACEQHTFQVLTKRANRMAEWFRWLEATSCIPTCTRKDIQCKVAFCSRMAREAGADSDAFTCLSMRVQWPLPNVWLGVSCERQEEADERIPLLLRCPAAVRWVSAEPLLGPVSFEEIPSGAGLDSALGGECWGDCACDRVWGYEPGCRRNGGDGTLTRKLDWVVWGGESGHGARPCDIDWIRSGVRECREMGIPVFVKQLGAHVVGEWYPGRPAGKHGLVDKKGADPAEWPDDLRVRKWPRGFTPPAPAKRARALPIAETP